MSCGNLFGSRRDEGAKHKLSRREDGARVQRKVKTRTLQKPKHASPRFRRVAKGLPITYLGALMSMSASLRAPDSDSLNA